MLQVRLFPSGSRGKDRSLLYEGGRDAASIITYINHIAGTWRAPGGGLVPGAGLIHQLQDLVMQAMRVSFACCSQQGTKAFAHAHVFQVDKGASRELLEEVKAVVSRLPEGQKREGKYYIKVLGQSAASGKGWVTNEVSHTIMLSLHSRTSRL